MNWAGPTPAFIDVRLKRLAQFIKFRFVDRR